MQEERLKILLEYLRAEPNEPFNIYAVAMEYLNIDEQKALFYLEKLADQYPDYIPTYYHLANLYAEIGAIEKARQMYLIGIEKAHQDTSTRIAAKAYDELRRAYAMFLDEID